MSLQVAALENIVQSLSVDTEGDLETMKGALENTVQSVATDTESAIEIVNARMVNADGGFPITLLSNVIDVIPAVGHVKSVLQHLGGDHEGGNKTLCAATRTTVVSSLATGGFAAISSGVAAGATYDLTAVIDKFHGSIAAVKSEVDKPSTDDPTATAITDKIQESIAAAKEEGDNPSAGDTINAIASPVCDDTNGSGETRYDFTKIFSWFTKDQVSAIESSLPDDSNEDTEKDRDELLSNSSSSEDDDSSSESDSSDN